MEEHIQPTEIEAMFTEAQKRANLKVGDTVFFIEKGEIFEALIIEPETRDVTFRPRFLGKNIEGGTRFIGNLTRTMMWARSKEELLELQRQSAVDQSQKIYDSFFPNRKAKEELAAKREPIIAHTRAALEVAAQNSLIANDLGGVDLRNIHTTAQHLGLRISHAILKFGMSNIDQLAEEGILDPLIAEVFYDEFTELFVEIEEILKNAKAEKRELNEMESREVTGRIERFLDVHHEAIAVTQIVNLTLNTRVAAKRALKGIGDVELRQKGTKSLRFGQRNKELPWAIRKIGKLE